MQRWTLKSLVAATLAVMMMLSLAAVPGTSLAVSTGVNPADTYIRAHLKDVAQQYNIPSVILMAIAYQESGWRQFDANGNPVIGDNGSSQDIGIMQINSSGRTDADRLRSDIDYNIETGAKMLDSKWKLAPGIGDRDRNVLENWYYAIWAYNGLSSTNNPNTPGGRHYQDKILALMAKQVLGSDGQPLWTPVTVTAPQASTIADPPVWIPTPQPVHYGDLYGGFSQGDNFRVLESPAGTVVSTESATPVSFLVQNVGTTTWDSTYLPVLAVGDPTVRTLSGNTLTGSVLPGGTVTVSFEIPSGLSAGALSVSLTMQKGLSAFGVAWTTQLTVSDIIAVPTMPESAVLGSVVSVPYRITGKDSMTVTPAFELRDVQGNLVESSEQVALKYGGTPVGLSSLTLPDEKTGEIRFFVGDITSGLLQPGEYELTVRFTAGASATPGVAGTVAFASATHKLQILAPSKPGLLIVDSSPVGAAVSVDGVSQPLLTPCAVQTTAGIHTVQLTEAHSASFSATVDTTAAPAALVTAKLVPLSSTPAVLNPSPVNLDFGVLKTGAGVTGQLIMRVTGSSGQSGVVSTSADWIRVSPLIFTGSQTFTVGIDARWINPNTNNTGTITFAMGTASVTVPIKAGFAPTPTVGFVLAPRSVQVNQDDEFDLNLTARNMQMLFDHVNLTVAWDPGLVTLEGATGTVSLKTPIPAPSASGILQIQSDVTGLSSGETILAMLRFKAITATGKTGVNLRGTVTLGNTIVRNTMGGSSIKVSQHFVLPGAPSSLVATGEQARVRIDWHASTSGTFTVTQYDIYRRQGAADLETAELIGTAKPDATEFIDRGPLERATYYYWIMAEDSKGNVSNPAGPVNAQPVVVSNPVTRVVIVFTLNKPTAVMNGVTVPMDTAPVIEEGRTILPVRYIATPLGAEVLWSQKDQKVTMTVGARKVELWIGKPTAKVNGKSVSIDPDNPKVVPRIIQGRTMLPLRFITEAFGAVIQFDARTRTVTVTLTKAT